MKFSLLTRGREMREWYRFLFSPVYETELGEALLQGSWAAGAAILAALWVSWIGPKAGAVPVLTTLVVAFGTITAIAVWLLTYLECMEWLAPWENREKRIRNPVTTPWRLGTSIFALAAVELVFYFAPLASIAAIRQGIPRGPTVTPTLLPVTKGYAYAFWVFFGLLILFMILQKVCALLDPSIPESHKRFPSHRVIKYAFVLVVVILALAAQSSSVPGLAFAFMPSLLGWFATTSGPLERLTNERPYLREALPKLLRICITHWLGWFILWESILYLSLAYLPWFWGI